ncbi:MAG: winged helix-turn-helix transcriptional regulator [Candidatus Bathyarchaeia archaeon]
MVRASKDSSSDLLRNKGELTRFQILVEVLRNQPHVKQKDIADALGVTVQAVSKYFKKLAKEGMLETGVKRANYKLTPKANKKLQDYLMSLERYVNGVKRDLKVERVWPAIAAKKIKAGERVSLVMRNGVLYALPFKEQIAKAYGTAVSSAEEGEDISLKDLKGEIELETGRILIVKLPSANEGGSKAVDMEKVRMLHEEFKPDRVGVMGTVGRAVLNKLGVKADIEFGISRASALAALRGLKVFVLVVGRMVNRIVDEIEATNLKYGASIMYEVRDGRKTSEAVSS